MDETLFNDDNKQNGNAANAGDGPKHIAWLRFIDLLGEKLRTIVETHSGGGMYRVPNDRFCLGLPEESVLGRHQRRFGSPGSDRTTYYSASGDQALTRMPSGCKYIAFEKCKTTANRLAAVARMRGRAEDLDSRPISYAGDGNAANSLRALLTNLNKPLLVMADPFELCDLQRASREIQGVDEVRSILFGVTDQHDGPGREDSERGWISIVKQFQGLSRIAWKWTGNPGLQTADNYLFFLQIATSIDDEGGEMLQRLKREHEILMDCRAASHAYVSDGPMRVDD